MRSRFLLGAAVGAAFLMFIGSPADPVSAAEHSQQSLVERTIKDALSAAGTSSSVASLPMSTEPQPTPVAEGEIVPNEPETIDAEELGTTVEFSGHEVDETLDVTISELADAARVTAEAETAGVAVTSPFDVTATTASGEDVSSFPADAVIEEVDDGPDIVTEVTPGVRFEIDVDESAIEGLDPASLRIMTREAAGDPWVEIPSYFDEDTLSVKGEIDHLSQFVVIGEPFEAPAGPRIVLDPDDDVGNTVGPGSPMTELPQNVRLANDLASFMTEACLADVLVTRTASSPAFLSPDVRAGMAAAHTPDLTVTLAFDAFVGVPWGVEVDGGSKAYSRGGALDNAVQASLVAELPGYTGRPAQAVSSSSYPMLEFDGLPGAMAHLETLYIDHNYDRVVIDQGFGSIVDGVFTGLGKYLETQGFDCTDPVTGGWPERPSAADLAKWRNLGYQNFQTYGADPVSFSTGNLVEDEPIFSLTGVGEQVLDLTLVYNAQDGRLTRTGAGWNFGLTSHAQRFGDGSVLVVRGDGASFVFEPNGVGGYTAEAGLYQTLTEADQGNLRLTAVDGESWLYDAADIDGIGELVEHTDRQGNSYTLAYGTPDENDQFVPLTSITDDAGQVVAIGHDDLGRISSFAHPDGRAWGLGYDADGNLISIVNPDGRSRTFTYDALHRMLSATDTAGITYLVNEYDEAGRVVKQWDAEDNVRTFSYDVEAGVGGETTYVDNEGNETVYAFDDRFRITSVTDALGHTLEYTYDDSNQVTSFTDARGQTHEYEYDAAGNAIAETSPDGTTVQHTYTPTGEVASITDEGGVSGGNRTTTYAVDALGLTTGVTRADGSAIANTYDANGDLTSTTDAAGGITAYTYDIRGNLASLTDPLAQVTTFAYDTANRVTSVTDPAGGATTFQWDSGDRLLSQTDAAGGVTTFTYDANDHPLTRTDPDGAVTRYEWDDLFRVVAVTAPDGGVTTYDYNAEDELVRTTDPLGGVTELELDALYRPVTMVDAEGEEWLRSYDEVGNVLSTTDPLGAVTEYSYDEIGRLVATTDALGGASETTYDEVGRVVAETDELGYETVFAYDVLDRLVRTTDAAGGIEQMAYDPLGNLTQRVDRRGNSTGYNYDAIGQLLSWTGPESTGETFAYDSRGNTVAMTDALGRTTTIAYDAVHRPVTKQDPLGGLIAAAYDAVGRVTSATDENGHSTTFGYDLAGRVTESIDPLGNATGYEYDVLGRKTAAVDATGTVTGYAYSPLGNLTSVTEGVTTSPAPGATDANVATFYTYTPIGDLATVTDPEGAVTAFEYDSLGRKTVETNPLGKQWRYVYDAVGRLTTETDAKGQSTDIQYTPLSDVAGIDYSNGNETTFQYDADQNLIAMLDPLGASTWQYDAAGRMIEQTDANGKTLTYSYDANGSRTSLSMPTGAVNLEYDEAGRPIRQSSPWGSLGYAYDPAGNLTDVLRSTGVASQYEYDAADRVTGITHTSPGSDLGCDLGANDIEVGADIETLIDLDLCVSVDLDLDILTGLEYGDSIDLDYGYDPTGNVTSQTRTDGSSDAVTTEYAYDALDRLTGSASSGGTTNSYEYDKAGNRTEWRTNRAPETNRSLRVEAEYNSVGQLTSEKKTRPGLLGLPSVTNSSYSYDDNGNRTRMQTGLSSTTYEYTPDDKLAQVSQLGRDVSYEYDGLGRALVETVESLLVLGEETTQLWDGLTVVGQDSSAFGETSLVRDATGEVAIQHNDALLTDVVRWGLTDRLGSAIAQTQGSKIGQLAEYSDWGIQSFSTLAWNSVAGYTGELGDSTSGLLNFYARSYDAAAGTWLSADPYRGTLTDPQSLARYGYVAANPITAYDILGFFGWGDVLAIATGIVVGVVVAAAVVGAVACVGSIVCGVVVGIGAGIAGGIAGSLAYTGASNVFGSQKYTPEERLRTAATDGAIGGATGGAGGAAGPLIGKVVNPIINKIASTLRHNRNMPAGNSFAVNASGEAVVSVSGARGVFQLTQHAAQRLTQRNISLDAVGDVLETRPFQYFHGGTWKTGFYDPVSGLFVGVSGSRVTTVIGNASQNYIDNLTRGLS